MATGWDVPGFAQDSRDWRFPVPPVCPRCSYNLTGLTEPRCPECGSRFHWGQVRQAAARIWSIIVRLERVDRDATSSLWLCGVGFLLWLVPKLIGVGYLRLIAGLGCVLIGLVALVASMHLLDVLRIPPYARAHVNIARGTVTRSTLAAVLSLALIATVILF
jgi:hypothetical protein